jgi:hypothetical protein
MAQSVKNEAGRHRARILTVKKFVIIVAVIALIIAAIGVYLVATTPGESRGVQFPLAGEQRALVASVPATAESFALIPTVAAVQSKLLANPATHDVVEGWMEQQDFPPSWVIGGADVLIFRSGKQTNYLVRLDPLRALLARTMLTIYGDSGSRVMINALQETPIAASDLAPLLDLSNSLPRGDAFVVQREGSHGSFPPIARPAVSSVAITPDAIDVISRSSAGEASPSVLHVRFAQSAILTAAFGAAPREIEETNRLVGARASTLLRDGGAIALYDVDTDKLLPRPREVIVLPATPERRAALDDFVKKAIPEEVRDIAGIHIETGEAPGELLVAFDRKSLDAYLKDTFAAPVLPANHWTIRIDPKRAGPILDQMTESPGLRLMAPHLFRSVRDLSGWIANLEKARSIEAASSISGGAEELRVHIATK